MASSRERRERRRRRRATERAEASAASGPVGGQGIATPPPSDEPPLPIHLQEKPAPRSDLVLEHSAVARGWIGAATPEIMVRVLRRQADLASDPKVSPRDSSRAARVYQESIRQVMRHEELMMGRSEADRLYDLALERARANQQPTTEPAPATNINISGPVQIYIPDNGRSCPSPLP